MTEKLYFMTEAQRQELFVNEPLSSSAVLMLDSLPMVSAEPVAHIYPWVLERFATAETTGHAYSVAVGCADGVSVPLYTSPQALTPLTADDVTDEMLQQIESAWQHPNASKGTHEEFCKKAVAISYNSVIKHRGEQNE